MMSSMTAQPKQPVIRVHWANSLIARVVALCVVLVLCLFGSVYVLTVHFMDEITTEFENKVLEMQRDVRFTVRKYMEEGDTVESAQHELERRYSDLRLRMAPTEATEQTTEVTSEITDDGIRFSAKAIVVEEGIPPIEVLWGQRLNTRDAVLRAFTNRYIALLTASFLIALGLMVYFIVKSLRPLRELTERCARISEGELAPVEIKRNYGEVLALEHTFNRMVNALQDKEQLEANLRQAQRLSALGALAAGIAHDVRNPLNAIKLLSSHALDSLSEPESNGPAEQLRTIRKEVDRLEDIVSGFLALAKERELQPEPIRIDRLVEDCVRLVKAEAESRDVTLSTELAAGDLQLDVDPKQMTRAIINVIINAIEACSPGGRVRVFSRVTEEACQIEVRDDGPGLTKDVAERAFDPYFTTKPTGTGIGLSITRGIIEEHGGTVSLSCELGRGCIAMISLPLRRVAA